jgi:large exoprotein involved in heme utilization and adhesion
LFDLHGNSSVTTSVAGGEGKGGNIFIKPFLMVQDGSRIAASALKGEGGNIDIVAGQFIQSPDAEIDASSVESISGTITIAAPNVDIAGTLVRLPGTFLDAGSQLRESCASRGGSPTSSITAGGRGGLPPDPAAPLSAGSLGQSQKPQAAVGSPAALMPQLVRTSGTLAVVGIPHPILGSPRPVCRG